ncbi:uncharacterized protein LOC129611916 [Condylostylus longicornis]|uniref:uncharacterized protein LOC129611916 n=1 Tax=Condylostylus longicornis TaxID=2530218 RepID=UPI00244DFADB|nr:uncharacterized protein LOC129611916 [Condylostylus longicornis]
MADENEKNEIYEQLTAAICKIPRTDILILMGDFNAKIGQRNPEEECSAMKYMDLVQELIVTEIPLTEEGIQKIYRRSGEEVVGTVSSERKLWISDDTWELINRRRALRRKLLTDTHNSAVREQHRRICKEGKRAARNDKRRCYNNIAAEAQVAAEQYNTKQLYKKVRLLSNKGLNKEHAIKDKNGNIITETQKQIERWVEHFNESSNTQFPDFSPGVWKSRNEEHNNINTSPSSSKFGKLKIYAKNGKKEL